MNKWWSPPQKSRWEWKRLQNVFEPSLNEHAAQTQRLVRSSQPSTWANSKTGSSAASSALFSCSEYTITTRCRCRHFFYSRYADFCCWFDVSSRSINFTVWYNPLIYWVNLVSSIFLYSSSYFMQTDETFGWENWNWKRCQNCSSFVLHAESPEWDTCVTCDFWCVFFY